MMGAVPVGSVIAVLLDEFAEAYEGPKGPNSWFIDNQPDTGVFGTLAAVPAGVASQPTVPGGTTVAAHAEHLRWSLALANEFLRGRIPQAKWQESWLVREVDPPAWERLQANLRGEYETVREAIAAHAASFQPQWLAGTMALVPHAAYHLGAIRQMLRVLGASGEQAGA